MAAVYGNLMLPTAQRTSQLVNDTRFSSIREYVLNTESMKDTETLEISDLALDSVIYRIDLIVFNPFTILDGTIPNIEVVDENDTILLDKDWNEPSISDTYSSNCYSTINSLNTKLKINHNLGSSFNGDAILRLYLYNNIGEYVHLLTSDNLYYKTMDNIGIDVLI